MYSGADLPDEIDWTLKSAISAVKDQGSCGSCWAFSTVGSLEGHAAIAAGNLQQFSEQQLVDCDKDFGDLGCKGGLMDTASQYLMQSKEPAPKNPTATLVVSSGPTCVAIDADLAVLQNYINGTITATWC